MIRVCAYLAVDVTLFLIRGPEELLSVRFACSPVWETLAAVRTFVDERARAYHEPWHRLVRRQTAQLDLSPLFAVRAAPRLRARLPDATAAGAVAAAARPARRDPPDAARAGRTRARALPAGRDRRALSPLARQVDCRSADRARVCSRRDCTRPGARSSRRSGSGSGRCWPATSRSDRGRLPSVVCAPRWMSSTLGSAGRRAGCRSPIGTARP